MGQNPAGKQGNKKYQHSVTNKYNQQIVLFIFKVLLSFDFKIVRNKILVKATRQDCIGKNRDH
jgi:hypothetical protein